MNARGICKSAVAEFFGTLFLLAAVVGSGIMGERLADGNAAVALLANSIATGAALFVLIKALGPVSGAHLNPAVTIALAGTGAIGRMSILPYVASQCAGAIVGVWTAHLMFDLPILQVSTHVRTGIGQWAGEFVATFGLLATIEIGKRRFADALAVAVALFIVAAYWFTSSTSFANPAVTIARSMTDSFAGIAPANVAGFIVAQGLGAAAAVFGARWLYDDKAVVARPELTAQFEGQHEPGTSQKRVEVENQIEEYRTRLDQLQRVGTGE